MGALAVINENSVGYIQISFYNKNGNLETPTSISYRIDDRGSEASVRTDTSFTPVANQIEITLEPGDNAILDDTNEYEYRVVTVTATYGANDQHIEEHEYAVKNLQFET